MNGKMPQARRASQPQGLTEPVTNLGRIAVTPTHMLYMA
jgi:hypothetical protein